MIPEVEKPRVTEIKVRMDCNGCVQKVRKALHGITGIYDLYIDFPEQKIMIIGWADPVKIVKALKKARKSAVICSHGEQVDQPNPKPEPEEVPPEGGAPPPEPNNPPTEAAPPAEDGHKEPIENPAPEEKPLPDQSANEAARELNQPSRPKDIEEIHVIYHHPPDYGYRYAHGYFHQTGNDTQWDNANPSGPGIGPEPPQPIYATHGYNTYRPSLYVTEYAYPQSAPAGYSHHSRPDHHGGSSGNGNGSITSMFSEENPNACSIV